MPADTPTPSNPLPAAVLASVLATSGSFLIREARQLTRGGIWGQWHHENIRRSLTAAEAALQAYERAEFEAHRAKQAPPSVVKSEGAS